MIEKLNEKILDQERYQKIIDKIGPDTETVFKEIKYLLGGRLPEELSYGIVAGFLRGKGYSWEESFLGMNRFISVIKALGVEGEDFKGTIVIKGSQDGSASVNMENEKDGK